MSLYSEIKSPFDDKNTLLELIKLYVEEDNISDYMFYKKVIKNENISEEERKRYYKNYLDYVFLPCNSAKYNTLASYEFKRHDEILRNYLENTIKTRPDYNEKMEKEARSYAEKHFFYPLSTYSKIFDEYKTYDDFMNEYENKNLDKANRLFLNIDLYPSYKERYTKELDQMGFTENEKEKYKLMCKLNRKLVNSFSGGPNVMGFHVNPSNLLRRGAHEYNPEMKFYINAGEDSFKVARIFQTMCQQKGINYYYKVVNPTIGEETRSDKLCIFSTFNDAPTFVSMLKEIRENNETINFRKPPLFCGTIDGFIGVGEDPKRDSYNTMMSECFVKGMHDTFKNVTRDNILPMIKNNPSKIDELLGNVITEIENRGYDNKKICISNEAKKKLGGETLN